MARPVARRASYGRARAGRRPLGVLIRRQPLAVRSRHSSSVTARPPSRELFPVRGKVRLRSSGRAGAPGPAAVNAAPWRGQHGRARWEVVPAMDVRGFLYGAYERRLAAELTPD